MESPASEGAPDSRAGGHYWAGYARLLGGNRNFRNLWSAQFVSGVGDWFYSIAIYDMLRRMTGSAESVAIAAVLQIIPYFVAGPIAGAVNDRISRRMVMLASDVLRAVVVLGMLVVDSPSELWLLYGILFVEMSAAAFFESARNAALPNVVAGGDLQLANALSGATWSVTSTLGVALGGLATRFFGREAAFLANSASYLLSAWLIRRSVFAEPHVRNTKPLNWQETLGVPMIWSGLRYMLRDARLVSLLALKFGLGILGARIVLATVIGADAWSSEGEGTLGMTMLFTFQGVGSVIGALVLVPLVGPKPGRMRWAILGGYLAVGVFYMLFSGIDSLLLGGLCLTAAHMGSSSVWVFSTTLVHANSDDRYRGRVFAADLGLFMVTSAVANYLCGWSIDRELLTAREAALLLGGAMLVPATVWALSLGWIWGARRERGT